MQRPWRNGNQLVIRRRRRRTIIAQHALRSLNKMRLVEV